MSDNPLPIIITMVGIYLLSKVGRVLCHPIPMLRALSTALSDRESRHSFILALAATLGVGNVFGVSLAIIVGGAGSIFWMLISVVFSSVIKYSEVLISTADGGEGGIYNTVRKTLGRGFATLYAVSAVILGLFMGAALQSNTVASFFLEIFNTPPAISGILLTLAVLLGIFLGTKFIPKITAIIIPLSTIIYIILCLATICTNIDGLGRALGSIISSAFDVKCVGGGLFGGFISGITEGYSRGILSNEAGAGTSTLAHGESRGTPHEKGVLGIFEVIFDTAILCLMTGITILTAIPDTSGYHSPTALIIDAITGSIGEVFRIPLLLAVLIFAYSTVITWYYYVNRSLSNIHRGEYRLLPVFYLFFVLLGALLPHEPLVLLTDLALLTLTVIVSVSLIKSSDRLKCLSETGLLNKSDSR